MEDTKPKGKLGLVMLTALVTGNMIGSGIFLLPSDIAHFGSIGILAWSLTAVGTLFLAGVFVYLSRVIPKSGGPYAYCREAYGDFIGFEVAYNYWMGAWVGNAAIPVAMVGYLIVFWPNLNGNPLLQFFVEAGVIWILTFINVAGIRNAGVVQVVTTVLKLIPLILIGTIGLLYIHPENLTQFNISGQSNFSALTAAAAITLWSFLGVESATVPAEDADDPKNIARATLLGTGISAVVYILGAVAIMGMIAPDVLQHSTAPYADASVKILGPWGRYFIAAGAIISCVGALNGWILLQGQVPMAAARDGLFPKPFARMSANGTPSFGLIASSVLVTILLAATMRLGIIKQFDFIILLAAVSILIPYMFCALAVLMLPSRRAILKPFGTFLMALIAGLYSFWMIAGAGEKIVAIGALIFFAGIPIYVWMRSSD